VNRLLGIHLTAPSFVLCFLEAALTGTACVAIFDFFFSHGPASLGVVPFAALSAVGIVGLMHTGGLYSEEALLDSRRMMWRIGFLAVPILIIAVWTGEEFGKHAVIHIHPIRLAWVHPIRLAWALIFTSFWLVIAVSLRVLFRQLYRSGLFTRRVLILGGDKHTVEYSSLADMSGQHFQVVGQVRSNDAEQTAQSAWELVSLARDLNVSEIVVAKDKDMAPWAQLVNCRLLGIQVTDYLDFYERECQRVCIDHLRWDWIALSHGYKVGRLKASFRRLLDVVVSVLGLIAVAPVLLMAALAIKLEDGGPIIYAQERVGRNGRTFVLLKFRSMRVDAERDGTPAWARERDNRITRVGRVIRKVRIDELPQLLNVLRGDMALIGPRPERPHFVQMFSESIPFYDYRHTIRPGITGWAQVCFRYGASFEDTKRKLSYDLYYIKRQGLLLDALILLKTIRVVLSGEGAR
jgi:sugar transferase (PEP-CTERM system associated)